MNQQNQFPQQNGPPQPKRLMMYVPQKQTPVPRPIQKPEPTSTTQIGQYSGTLIYSNGQTLLKTNTGQIIPIMAKSPQMPCNQISFQTVARPQPPPPPPQPPRVSRSPPVAAEKTREYFPINLPKIPKKKFAQKTPSRAPPIDTSSLPKKPKPMDSLSELLRASESPTPPPKVEKIKKYALARPPPRDDPTPLEEMDFSRGLGEIIPEPIPLHKFAEFKPTQPLVNYESKYFVPYDTKGIQLEEITTALEFDLTRMEFDVKKYFNDLLKTVYEHKTQVWRKGEKLHHDRNVFNFEFVKDSSLKLWRCHNSIFTLKSDKDTLDVTVAMCNSISRNRWDTIGQGQNFTFFKRFFTKVL